MIALWILLGILALLFLIGMIRGTLTIAYATAADTADGTDEMTDAPVRPILRLKIAGIRIFTFPKAKKRIKRRRYSRRAMQKRAAKAAKAQARKDAGKSQKKQKSVKTEEKKEKKSISDTIDLVLDLSRLLLSRLARHLKIKAARVRVIVATPDAAETALLYGAVSQSVAYLFAFLEENASIAYAYKPEVSVEADFATTRTRADISLSFSIRVWQVVSLLFRLFLQYLKHKKKHQTERIK